MIPVTSPPRFRAAQIAALLDLPKPTEEQVRIIEAQPNSQKLVIAGAGSGKTETMAHRVLWLVANNYQRPDEILGLTFSRRAASELGERVNERLKQLGHKLQLGSGRVGVDFDGINFGRSNIDGLNLGGLSLDEPNISTYHSFAGAIYSEHALLIGREPDAKVIGEATAWQIVRRIVGDSTDLNLIDLTFDVLVEAVLKLSHGISEHAVPIAKLRDFVAKFLQLDGLPIGNSKKRTEFVSYRAGLNLVARINPLLDLVKRFQDEKSRLELVEYSDQVALALQICVMQPQVVQDFRAKYGTILLDEYQDTSVIQGRLLAALFKGQSIIAVGDPDQSVYGWRGASAANLSDFAQNFIDNNKLLEPGDPVNFFGETDFTMQLSTSWRNSQKILAVANTLLNNRELAIAKKDLNASPNAQLGSVEFSWFNTIEAESAAVAEWFARNLDYGSTGAILLRSLKAAPEFEAELTARKIPYQTLGFGGLLMQPVVVDLLCVLRVISDPTADSELIRLLSGARWQISPADIGGLKLLAKWFWDRDAHRRLLSSEVRGTLRGSAVDVEAPSLIDALDHLIGFPHDHPAVKNISAEAMNRMKQAGRQLRKFRHETHLDLVQLVTEVQQQLLLDIEVLANSNVNSGLDSLDAIEELAVQYCDLTDDQTIAGFFSWLSEADKRDRLTVQQEVTAPGAVQILTIHGAKGLEWDLVAVPNFVKSAAKSGSRTWLTLGELPYPLRGDAAELPEFQWYDIQTQKEYDDNLEIFKTELAQYESAEDRRLAYVAVTRAREQLLLSGSWWTKTIKAREPVEFISELALAGHIEAPPGRPDFEQNPRTERQGMQFWPLDPLGLRRCSIEDATAQVLKALDGVKKPLNAELEIQLKLLIEENNQSVKPKQTPVPIRIAASKFQDYISTRRLVNFRPAFQLPQKPSTAGRTGSAFHNWVENRSSQSWLEQIDPEIFENQSVTNQKGEAARLKELQKTFETSAWGKRKPKAVELEIYLPLAGQVFICKLDAVYLIEEGDELAQCGYRSQIVDWKTGVAPKTVKETRLRSTQLALYRLAYAKLTGQALDEIDAIFYYVSTNTIVRPEHLYDENRLRELWEESGGSSGSPTNWSFSTLDSESDVLESNVSAVGVTGSVVSKFNGSGFGSFELSESEIPEK